MTVQSKAVEKLEKFKAVLRDSKIFGISKPLFETNRVSAC